MKRTHPPFQNNALTEASIEGNHNYSEFRNDHNQADNINACLKRIRISSTSPGELALISDLTHLCREISLHRLDENTWFTADNKLRLQRDESDSLSLILGVATSNEKSEEVWSFYINIPRMYPHEPPIIHRSTCKSLKTQEEQQLPDILVVNNPDPSVSAYTVLPTKYKGQSEKLFAVYNKWSPVSRLQDLIMWLFNLSNQPTKYRYHHHLIPNTWRETSNSYNNTTPSNTARHRAMQLYNSNRFNVGFPTNQQKMKEQPKRSLSMSDFQMASINNTRSVNTWNPSLMMDDDMGQDENSERFLSSCGSIAGASHAGRYDYNVATFQAQSKINGHALNSSAGQQTHEQPHNNCPMMDE